MSLLFRLKRLWYRVFPKEVSTQSFFQDLPPPTIPADKIITAQEYFRRRYNDREGIQNYYVRMGKPGAKGSWPVPANKYQKWYGQGYRLVE